VRQLAERDLALAPHYKVDAAVRVLGVGFGSQARIIAAHDDARAGAPHADEIDDPFGRLALKGHDREPDDVGLVFGHEPLDGLPDPVLNEQQVRCGYPTVGIDVSGEGRQRPVRHPDGDRRHVFERVRHREQQDVHRRAPAFVGPPPTFRSWTRSCPETLARRPSRMRISRRTAQRSVRRPKSEIPESPRKGPRVRIPFPPAASQANFRIARVARRVIFLIAV